MYLLDVHADDFVYKPVGFWLTKRKPLRKYKYLSDIGAECIRSNFVSSIPQSWHRYIPKFLMKCILYMELFIWEYLNSEICKYYKVLDSDKPVFIFGYKSLDYKLNYLIKINYNGKVYIHLSHYHLFDIKNHWFDQLNIILVFDCDVSNHQFFKEKFPKYTGDLVILPFCIDERFFIKFKDGIQNQIDLSVAITGTYHDMPIGVLPFNVENSSTLHPDRLKLSRIKDLPDYCKNHLAIYDSNQRGFFSIWKKMLAGQQKNYFKVDLVSLYSSSSYVFIGSEGTGAFGIGTIEAMAAGCIPILPTIHKPDFLDDKIKVDILWYDSFSQLLDILIQLGQCSSVKSERNATYAYQYKSKKLTEKARVLFCI